jgi:hypothetical protein
MSIKKRLALGAGAVATVGAVATLVAGVTFGLFSATQTGSTNTFTAGTVTLTNPVNVSCTVGPMAPGDSSTGYTPVPAGQTDPQTAACTFAVTYGGNLPAYLGVDAAVGGTSLYDGTGSGLQFQISDGPTSYATGGVLNGTSDLLVSTTPDAASSSTLHTLTVNYALPTASPNSYQGKSTTLTLTIHAVQSGNNNFVGGCTAGHTCGVAANWS